MNRNPKAEAAACSRKKEGRGPEREVVNKEIGKGDCEQRQEEVIVQTWLLAVREVWPLCMRMRPNKKDTL